MLINVSKIVVDFSIANRMRSYRGTSHYSSSQYIITDRKSLLCVCV